MRKTLIALAVLASMSAPVAHAEVSAWQVVADRLPAVDVAVDVVGGHYWVTPADLLDLDLDLSRLESTNGKIDLSSIGAVTADDANATLHVKTRSDLLPVTEIDLANTYMFMKPETPTGTFLNYDVRANASPDNSASNSLTGLFDGNTFVRETRFNAQVIARTNSTPRSPTLERLAANVSREDAETATTWLVGDGYTNAGANVAPVRFLGAQYRKDFNLTPGFITSPASSMAGVAAAPSTVDVLMGNQVVRSQQVPAGPFSITNLQPLVGAQGAQVVLTDVFGQQQIITSQILGNPALLREGLSDFAVQVGQVRPTLSTSESAFASGFYRLGLTPKLTAEANGEISAAGVTLPGLHRIGGNAALATPAGNFSAGARVGSGLTANLGYQNAWRFDEWHSSLNASVIKTSANFNQLGGGVVPPLSQAISASLSRDRVSLTSLYSKTNGIVLMNVGLVLVAATPNDITWSINCNQFISDSSKTSLAFNASIPLDVHIRTSPNRSHQGSAGASINGGQASTSLDYANRSTSGFGESYRAHIEDSTTSTRMDGYIDHRSFEVDVGVAASIVSQQTALRAYARGALVKAADSLGFTRWIDNSFAVIDAGTADAVVQVNGVPNATTNRNGVAVVSGFQPFIKTAVRLAPESIPDNYDDLTSYISTYRRAQANIKFRGHSMAMVHITGITKGVLTISDQDYPITSRGAFVELPEGSYMGAVAGKTVLFTIPKATSDLVTVEAAFPKNINLGLSQ